MKLPPHPAAAQRYYRYVFASSLVVALILAFLIALGGLGPRAHASASPQSDNARFTEILSALASSPMGEALIASAERAWGTSPGSSAILSHLKWGETSKTDAVLTRFLNPKTGEERRERRVAIFLKRDQSKENLILDLAHELVHAATRPVWDPYDPSLTPARYIRSAIDGQGGEVDAVIAECRVGLELGLDLGSSAARCRSYFEKGEPQGKILRDKVALDFYRSGIWAEALKNRLGAEEESLLPLLSSEPPVLYSSTGKLPYPMALYQEFQALTEIACRNTANRLSIGTSNVSGKVSGPVRALASRFVSQRCNGVLPNSSEGASGGGPTASADSPGARASE